MRLPRVVSLIVIVAVARLSPAVAADHLQTPPHGPAEARVSVCFVPEQECDTGVAEAIAAAAHTIRVQAYGFTSRVILRALVAAWGRGVDVQVILDKSDERDHGSRAAAARFTADAGIPTWIDDKVAIAHNKVIIIDGHLVIGGSYNYTAAAERRNAENVTFIDAPVVADFYLVNWETRKAVSRPSRFEAGPGADEAHVVASAGGR
ncbi:phospholipase D-like domain-containing protein [Rhodopila globiformis]|jgi:phosphatidylserine/phosphatidylglycerophosphate/cardiolipin synthase-like enzyme|nr:phospholipase D-like domain-containing protein [Rhodopila globiformis]